MKKFFTILHIHVHLLCIWDKADKIPIVFAVQPKYCNLQYIYLTVRRAFHEIQEVSTDFMQNEEKILKGEHQTSFRNAHMRKI